MKKVSSALILISLSVASSLLALLIWFQQVQLAETSIVFLNVGQGDAILIQQGRHQILIDSGKDARQLMSELGRYVPFWDRHIEMIIPSHPDADHIGGYPGLTLGYSIGRVLWTGVEGESDIYTKFVTILGREVPEDRWQKMAAGSKLTLPQGGELIVLYPYQVASGKAKDEDTNATSMVIRFTYGETSFLLTGDLAEEEKVLGRIEPVTILKAGHHGSKYSTSNTFLSITKPAEVVISVGKNNYGHPSQEVLERITNAGAKILRTDQEGSIEYQCIKEENRCAYQGARRY